MAKQSQVNEVYTNLITFVDGLDDELSGLLKQNNQILMDQNTQFLNMMEKQNSDLIQFVNGNIENTQLCISAYRKKQEFFEGYLFMDKKICTNKSFFTDHTSLISQKF